MVGESELLIPFAQKGECSVKRMVLAIMAMFLICAIIMHTAMAETSAIQGVSKEAVLVATTQEAFADNNASADGMVQFAEAAETEKEIGLTAEIWRDVWTLMNETMIAAITNDANDPRRRKVGAVENINNTFDENTAGMLLQGKTTTAITEVETHAKLPFDAVVATLPDEPVVEIRHNIAEDEKAELAARTADDTPESPLRIIELSQAGTFQDAHNIDREFWKAENGLTILVTTDCAGAHLLL